MIGRNVLLYYAWSRQGETGAPLAVIENRFPALFESRRMLFPQYEELSDPIAFDQGISGFLDHIMKTNFEGFASLVREQTGHPLIEIERGDDRGELTELSPQLLQHADTLIIISFDSLRTDQNASAQEIEAISNFLNDPDHVVFICPHHDIGEVPDLTRDRRLEIQQAAFLHHGDKTIPPQQGFGGFGRSLAAGLGVPVENRFGLRPASTEDGVPAPIEAERSLDRLGLLRGVETLNLHPHLPHFERLGDSLQRMDVLVRQKIDLTAPPHPFTAGGRTTFDALLQSRPNVFPGSLLIGDATIWSSSAGGLESLKRLWSNVAQRPLRSAARV